MTNKKDPNSKSRLRKIIVRSFAILGVIIALMIASLLIVYEIRYEVPQAAPQSTPFTFMDSGEKQEDGLFLLPVPKQVEYGSGSFAISDGIRFESPADVQSMVENALYRYASIEASAGSANVAIRVQPDGELPRQGYRLTVSTNGISIAYADRAGLYYGLNSLGQIHSQSDGALPAMTITDWPDLEIRGAMLDISRDKIPTMETLREIIDMLSLLKYNHLQLYVEGFSFGYPSFRELWEETETPVTGSEMEELEQFAAQRMIELVPNQNVLGHMSAWLATERFAHLAECPDGYMLMGLIEHNSTLDVSNPESYELVEQMLDDMLPHFSSGYFNANLDEPFELGQCNTRELAEERGGAGYLYLDFLKRLNSDVRNKHDRQLMIWGDIVAKHPEIIPEIPEDIILIEWGYESFHPFDAHTERIAEAGLPFLVAPGTSSWTTITGRTDNMMGNIDIAVDAALAHGGLGMLLTDWGDLGHWQYWPISWVPLTYGAAISWNADSREYLPLTDYLNRMIFMDESAVMAALVMDLGQYNRFEEFSMINMTTTMQSYLFGINDPVLQAGIQNRILREFPDLLQVGDEVMAEILGRFDDPKPYNHQAILEYTTILGERLQNTRMQGDDAELVIDEMVNAIRMIRLGALTRHYVQWMREYSASEKLELLTEMKELVEMIIPEHERLWLARNRSGGLDRSLNGFRELQQSIESEIRLQQRNPAARFFVSQGQKLVAAGAALYID